MENRILAFLSAVALAGCSQAAGLPGTSPVAAANRVEPRAFVSNWTVSVSNRCPAQAEKIAVVVAATGSTGAIIKGKYSQTFTLIDTDYSGATKLSRTSITDAAQTVTLSYDGKKIAPFYLDVETGNETKSAYVRPHTECINSKPPLIELPRSGGPVAFKLSGAGGVTAPYSLTSAGAPGNKACGSAVTVSKVGASEFRLAAVPPAPSQTCPIFATAKYKTYTTNQDFPVLIYN